MNVEDFRIDSITKELSDLREIDKERAKSIIEIEKSNIRQEGNLKAILETYQIIKNAVLGFAVINVLGILITFWIKK